jgi:hypothetical protein
MTICLAISFLLRLILDNALPWIVRLFTGSDAEITSFNFGAFEYFMIKAGHLGLCQAAGFAFSAAKSTTACGHIVSTLWALAICWLLSFPLGFTCFLAYKLTKSLATNQITFRRKENSGSWSVYFSKVRNANGSAQYFCVPNIIHYCSKFMLSVCGFTCILLGLSFASNSNDAHGKARVVLLFLAGIIALIAAVCLSSKLGRRVVVAMTNSLAWHLGYRFVIMEGGSVERISINTVLPSGLVSKILFSIVTVFTSTMGWILAKVEVMAHPSNLWDLSNRGRWVRENNLGAFYSEYNDRGAFYAIFLMGKNVILGILLADDPDLANSLSKVQSLFFVDYIHFIFDAFLFLFQTGMGRFLPLLCRFNHLFILLSRCRYDKWVKISTASFLANNNCVFSSAYSVG